MSGATHAQPTSRPRPGTAGGPRVPADGRSETRPADAEALIARLVEDVGVADDASARALLAFTELLERKLYLDLGHLSIRELAEERLGFSRRKSEQFAQLARALRRHASLRASIEAGRIGWTKARVLATVITRRSAARWVTRAEKLSRRELEQLVRETRRRAWDRRRRPVQVSLAAPPAAGNGAPTPADPTTPAAPVVPTTPSEPTAPPTAPTPTGPAPTQPAPTPSLGSPTSRSGVEGEPLGEEEIMLTLSVRMSSLERARAEAILEALRKAGHRESRGTLLVAALECLLGETQRLARRRTARRAGLAHEASRSGEARSGRSGDPARSPDEHAVGSEEGTRPEASTRPTDHADGGEVRAGARSRYQVVVHVCPSCRRGSVRQGERDVTLPTPLLETALDDADVVVDGRLRASIPPSVRRRVLARDGHRCSAPGCGSSLFLDVHHRLPVAEGGTNDPDNLITLCASCHRAVHERAWRNRPPE